MRRSHVITALLTALLATTGALSATAAIPVHEASSLPRPSCTAKPGLVSETSTMRVKAGKVVVTCGHAWRGTEVVQYRDIYARPGKWIFGGTRSVSGVGDVTLPSFIRDYKECGDWRLHFMFKNGDSFNGPISWFCTS